MFERARETLFGTSDKSVHIDQLREDRIGVEVDGCGAADGRYFLRMLPLLA